MGQLPSTAFGVGPVIGRRTPPSLISIGGDLYDTIAARYDGTSSLIACRLARNQSTRLTTQSNRSISGQHYFGRQPSRAGHG